MQIKDAVKQWEENHPNTEWIFEETLDGIVAIDAAEDAAYWDACDSDYPLPKKHLIYAFSYSDELSK